MMVRAMLTGLLLLAGCAAPPSATLRPAEPQRWLAVLVAGDGSLPVFDNATGGMAALLERSGVPAGDVHRLSAAPGALSQPRTQVATRARVLQTIATLRPAPGQGCLVFITSHGGHGEGVYLAPRTEFLTPGELDAALRAGCGIAPTVAIVSACYSGDFARPPLAQPNRVLLTAAAADRPSFGCGVGRQLAYYDQCLLGALDARPSRWADAIAQTEACVARLEHEEGEPPSHPQSAVGGETAGLPVVGG